MRRPMVAGNWKMNGNRAEAAKLVNGILEGMGDVADAEVVVCPPYILIPEVGQRITDSAVRLGAQNLNVHASGAHTGEISGPMLRDFGCVYCIVGHSERRAMYGESSSDVAAKFEAAQHHGLVPVLCVGETLEQREKDATEAVIAEQLQAVLSRSGAEGFRNAVIAYEPVWAIGTGRTATPQQAQAVHAFIRGLLASNDKGIAGNVRILYGGSVKGDNAADLFAEADIDGGLIGGASLKSDEFLAICRAA